MAGEEPRGDDRAVVGLLAPSPTSIVEAIARALPKALTWPTTLVHAKLALRWLSGHTGMPVVVVAAVLLVVGYRLLKRTARFALHVGMVLALLACAELLGWIRW